MKTHFFETEKIFPVSYTSLFAAEMIFSDVEKTAGALPAGLFLNYQPFHIRLAFALWRKSGQGANMAIQVKPVLRFKTQSGSTNRDDCQRGRPTGGWTRDLRKPLGWRKIEGPDCPVEQRIQCKIRYEGNTPIRLGCLRQALLKNQTIAFRFLVVTAFQLCDFKSVISL